MAARYVIPDEPTPGRLQALVVTPFATLLGVMFGGTVVGLGWMLLNGWAMGSATRIREAVIAGITVLVQVGIFALLLVLLALQVVPESAGAYFGVLLHAARLAGAYAIYARQEASFELYRHFGGATSRYGVAIAIALLVIRIGIATLFADWAGLVLLV